MRTTNPFHFDTRNSQFNILDVLDGALTVPQGLDVGIAGPKEVLQGRGGGQSGVIVNNWVNLFTGKEA